MHKLRNAAIATGLFVGGTFGAIQLDNYTTNLAKADKASCYEYELSPEQVKFCIDDVNKSHETQYLAIGLLELGSIAGAVASGVVAIKSLRDQ